MQKNPINFLKIGTSFQTLIELIELNNDTNVCYHHKKRHPHIIILLFFYEHNTLPTKYSHHQNSNLYQIEPLDLNVNSEETEGHRKMLSDTTGTRSETSRLWKLYKTNKPVS